MAMHVANLGIKRPGSSSQTPNSSILQELLHGCHATSQLKGKPHLQRLEQRLLRHLHLRHRRRRGAPRRRRPRLCVQAHDGLQAAAEAPLL